MIRTAEQMLAEIGQRQWRYPAKRRSRLAPPEPCRNADKGCPHTTKGRRCGHGWCGNCYDRNRKYGDSWHHSPNMQYCTKPNCFRKGTPGHP